MAASDSKFTAVIYCVAAAICLSLASSSLVAAQPTDPVADAAMARCVTFGFTRGTVEFAKCSSEQAKVLSETNKPSAGSAVTDKVEWQSSQAEHTENTPAPEPFPQAESTATQELPANVVNAAMTIKFTGSSALARSATIVPTGAIEVDVQSNKGGAAAFGILGALVEAAATSEKSQSDESVISEYVTASVSDPRTRFAALLAEYLGSCFSETESYTQVVQPLLGEKAWRLKDKRLDDTRYESIPKTDYIIEAKLGYIVVKTMFGTQLMTPINVSVFRQKDLKEVKRFSSLPNKLFGEFSALDGVSELDAPTGDVLRDGAMKISNKICKAKL